MHSVTLYLAPYFTLIGTCRLIIIYSLPSSLIVLIRTVTWHLCCSNRWQCLWCNVAIHTCTCTCSMVYYTTCVYGFLHVSSTAGKSHTLYLVLLWCTLHSSRTESRIVPNKGSLGHMYAPPRSVSVWHCTYLANLMGVACEWPHDSNQFTMQLANITISNTRGSDIWRYLPL